MYPGQTADPAGQALQVTGGKFMAPEHVSMIQNADPIQRAKMARMREESIASKNGTKAEHSPYNVIADEFESGLVCLVRLVSVIGRHGRGSKATNQMDQNNVRTLTGDLAGQMMTQLLADNESVIDPKLASWNLVTLLSSMASQS